MMPRIKLKATTMQQKEMLLKELDDAKNQIEIVRKQEKEMLLKVWRGKWGPLMAESRESDGWEEERHVRNHCRTWDWYDPELEHD
ncbi:hypothetical protein Tco_0109952, partial [Tanacetum coccineum]